MSDYTLAVPDDVLQRAREIANETAQSVDTILLAQLKRLPGVLPRLEPEEVELAALRQLSDDTLWTIAKERLPADVRARMEVLMDNNNFGKITDAEYRELDGYIERGHRLTLRKSEAVLILQERGHHLPL